MVDDLEIRKAANKIRELERDVRRFEELELCLRYLKEHGGEIRPSVSFAASAVHGCKEASEFVKQHLFANWEVSGRRLMQKAIEVEMAEIKQRLL